MLKQSIMILDKSIKDSKKTNKDTILSQKDASDILAYLYSLEDVKKLTDKVK